MKTYTWKEAIYKVMAENSRRDSWGEYIRFN